MMIQIIHVNEIKNQLCPAYNIANEFDYIAFFSLIVAALALFYTVKINTISKINILYNKVLNDDLLDSIPESLSLFLEENNVDNYEKLANKILEIKQSVYFFDLYNHFLYKRILKQIIFISDDLEYVMQNSSCHENKDRYLHSLNHDFRKLYRYIYKLSFFRIILYEIIDRVLYMFKSLKRRFS